MKKNKFGLGNFLGCLVLGGSIFLNYNYLKQSKINSLNFYKQVEENVKLKKKNKILDFENKTLKIDKKTLDIENKILKKKNRNIKRDVIHLENIVAEVVDLESYVENPYLSNFYSKDEISEDRKAVGKIELSLVKASSSKKGIENIIKNMVMFTSVFKPKEEIADYMKGFKPNKSVNYYTKTFGCGLLLTEDGVILTSEHVIRNEFMDFNKNLIIDPITRATYNTTVLAIDTSNDLALVKADGFKRYDFKKPEFLNASAIKKGSLVFSNRFSLKGLKMNFFKPSDRYIENRHYIDMKLDSRKGKVLDVVHNNIIFSRKGNIINDYLVTSKISEKGFSGSFVVNHGGQVLGIISMGTKKNDKIVLSDACYKIINNFAKNQK